MQPLFENIYMSFPMICSTEAVAQRCSVKKVFLEISQNLQENTCARVSFLINAGGVGGYIVVYLDPNDL